MMPVSAILSVYVSFLRRDVEGDKELKKKKVILDGVVVLGSLLSFVVNCLQRL